MIEGEIAVIKAQAGTELISLPRVDAEYRQKLYRKRRQYARDNSAGRTRNKAYLPESLKPLVIVELIQVARRDEVYMNVFKRIINKGTSWTIPMEMSECHCESR